MINAQINPDRGAMFEYPVGNSLRFPGDSVSIVSRGRYQRIERDDLAITCLESEAPIISKCLSGHKFDSQESLSQTIQGAIRRGIFAILGRDSVMIGAPLFDDTLAVSNLKDKTIVCDSPSDIALFQGAPVSLPCLAMNLINTLPYYPFQSASLWEGVRRLMPLHVLVRANNDEWGEVVGAMEAASAQGTGDIFEVIRSSILESIARNVTSGDRTSADLSGGVDSAVIAYMLRALRAQSNFYHAKVDPATNSDSAWANLIARDAGISYTSLPPLSETGKLFDFESKYSRQVLLDTPMLWSDSEGYAEQIVCLEGGRGKGIHFTGLGGDELFAPMPAFAWSAARESRSSILFSALLYSLATRATFRRGFTEITDDTDYFTELTNKVESAFSVTNHIRPDEGRVSGLSWLGPISIPRWMTDVGRQLALKEIEGMLSKRLNPLSDDRSRHQSIESVLFQRRVLSQLNHLYVPRGVEWVSPFTDPHVVASALTLSTLSRQDHRVTKPGLCRATRGIVPREVFARSTKGDYSSDLYGSYRTSIGSLREEARSLTVVELGLVDPEKLMDELSMPTAKGDRVGAIARLVAVERWARNAFGCATDKEEES